MKSSMSIAVGVAVVAIMFSGSNLAVGQPASCNQPGLACNFLANGLPDQNCPKAPTSLAIANGPSAGNNPGWSPNGSQCGINVSTKKPCGGKLSSDCCNCSSTGGGSGDPCDIDPFFPGCGDGGGGGGGCWGALGNDCGDGAAPSLLAMPAAAVAARLGGMVQQALPAAAEHTLSALAQLKSIHLVASTSVTMRDPAAAHAAPPRSTADYEYWESGAAYRIRNTLDPKFGLVDVPEWAFDGKYHQMLMGAAAANSVLSVHRGDERSMFVPLENPVSLALDYLSLEDSESCVACELRLADLRYLAGLRAGVPEPAAFISPSETASGQRLVLRGGRSYDSGHPSTNHQLALDAKGHVISIKDVDTAGHLLRQIELADFRPVAGLDIELPRSVTLSKSNGDDPSPWFVARYEIGTLEVNQAIDRSTFNLISLPRVHKIWDSDHNVFMKYERVPGDTVCPSKKGAS